MGSVSETWAAARPRLVEQLTNREDIGHAVFAVQHVPMVTLQGLGPFATADMLDMNLWRLFLWPLKEQQLRYIDACLSELDRGRGPISGDTEEVHGIMELMDTTAQRVCGKHSATEVVQVKDWAQSLLDAIETQRKITLAAGAITESDMCSTLRTDPSVRCCSAHAMEFELDAARKNTDAARSASPFDIEITAPPRHKENILIAVFPSGSRYPMASVPYNDLNAPNGVHTWPRIDRAMLALGLLISGCDALMDCLAHDRSTQQ